MLSETKCGISPDVRIAIRAMKQGSLRCRSTLQLICLLASLLLSATARGALDIQAKAVITESNKEEEMVLPQNLC
jgi:hypothetical protein